MVWRSGALESLEMMRGSRPDADFWHGKRVLLTGHTGFKGAWLALWLEQLGAKVTGLALPASTAPSLHTLLEGPQCGDSDIRDASRTRQRVREANPQIVLHLAAQALVRASYRDPIANWNSNLMGTVHVLDAMRDLPDLQVAVLITTDKVYRNQQQQWPFRENDELGGHDPYSASKAACELAIASYRDAFLAAQGVRLASARAGNVIGGGDWAPDRLIPDAVRAWQSGSVLQVRQPDAVRPWQHVLEPLAGYLRLAEHLWHHPAGAGAYNFGPHTHEAATVRDVIEHARAAFGSGTVQYGNSDNGPHEASWLSLEIAKSRSVLDIQPHWTLPEAVRRSLQWYRALQDGHAARTLCLQDIADYGVS